MLHYLVNIPFILWGFSEVLIIARKRVPQNTTIKDSNSSIQIVFIIITLILGIGFGNSGRVPLMLLFPFGSSFWEILGPILLLTGIAVRWISIGTLKNYFTVNLTIQEDHQLITAGIYKNIRHPSYLGLILCFAGFGIALDNFISLFFILIINLIVILYRIDFEEKILADKFGPAFEEYRKNSRKLLPFVW